MAETAWSIVVDMQVGLSKSLKLCGSHTGGSQQVRGHAA